MGCCEANKVLKYNNRTELITKINNPTEQRDESKRKEILRSGNMEIFSKNDNNNEIECSQHKDFDTEIPQIKEVRMPSMKIPLDIVQTKKHLELTIIESKYLPENRKLTINPGGLVGSERNEQDGITIFGVTNVIKI